jgi:hypothetical protein
LGFASWLRWGVLSHDSIDLLGTAQHFCCDITLALLIDPSALQMLLIVVTGWLERREREALAYLIEENLWVRQNVVANPAR